MEERVVASQLELRLDRIQTEQGYHHWKKVQQFEPTDFHADGSYRDAATNDLGMDLVQLSGRKK
jgi:hypothetical protein